MNHFRKNVLLVMFYVIGLSAAVGQSRPLDKYDFESGGYQLIGIFAHIENHKLQMRLGEFFTDDIKVLNSIKKAWIFNKPQHQYACGYHYYIIVLKNGLEQNLFPVNLECNEIVTKDGSRYFSLNKLSMFAKSFKPLFSKNENFRSIALARETWKKIQLDKDFVYADEPDWLKFEGSFGFRAKCPSSVSNCFAHAEKMMPSISSEISKTHPGELFKLTVAGGSSNNEAFYAIACNKTLEEKFNLYDRWDGVGLGKWGSFPLYLNSYWKSKK